MASRARKKQITTLFNKVIKNTNKRIREIKKMASPDERVTQYDAVSETLLGFHAEDKPRTIDRENLGMAAFAGAMLGLMAGGLLCAAIAPYAAGPVIAAFFGGGLVSGLAVPTVLVGIFGGKRERKRLRAKYGTVRNARRMYRLKQKVWKRTQKDWKTVCALKNDTQLREQFDQAYRKEGSAPAGTTSVPTASGAKLRGPAV